MCVASQKYMPSYGFLVRMLTILYPDTILLSVILHGSLDLQGPDCKKAPVARSRFHRSVEDYGLSLSKEPRFPVFIGFAFFRSFGCSLVQPINKGVQIQSFVVNLSHFSPFTKAYSSFGSDICFHAYEF